MSLLPALLSLPLSLSAENKPIIPSIKDAALISAKQDDTDTQIQLLDAQAAPWNHEIVASFKPEAQYVDVLQSVIVTESGRLLVGALVHEFRHSEQGKKSIRLFSWDNNTWSLIEEHLVDHFMDMDMDPITYYWHFEIDSRGYSHVLSRSDNEVYTYHTNISGEWKSQILPFSISDISSLIVDNNGHAHIVASIAEDSCKSNNGNTCHPFYYVTNKSGDWKTEKIFVPKKGDHDVEAALTIGTEGYVHVVFSVNSYEFPICSYKKHSSYKKFSSSVYMSYSKVLYITNQSGKWEKNQIANGAWTAMGSACGGGLITIGSTVGSGSIIKIDNNNKAVIGYEKVNWNQYTGSEMLDISTRYNTQNLFGLRTTSVLDDTTLLDLLIDSTGKPHILYHSEVNDDSGIHLATKDTNKWLKEKLNDAPAADDNKIIEFQGKIHYFNMDSNYNQTPPWGNERKIHHYFR